MGAHHPGRGARPSIRLVGPHRTILAACPSDVACPSVSSMGDLLLLAITCVCRLHWSARRGSWSRVVRWGVDFNPICHTGIFGVTFFIFVASMKLPSWRQSRLPLEAWRRSKPSRRLSLRCVAASSRASAPRSSPGCGSMVKVLSGLPQLGSCTSPGRAWWLGRLGTPRKRPSH